MPTKKKSESPYVFFTDAPPLRAGQKNDIPRVTISQNGKLRFNTAVSRTLTSWMGKSLSFCAKQQEGGLDMENEFYLSDRPGFQSSIKGGVMVLNLRGLFRLLNLEVSDGVYEVTEAELPGYDDEKFLKIDLTTRRDIARVTRKPKPTTGSVPAVSSMTTPAR